MGHRLDNARHQVAVLSTEYKRQIEALANSFRDRMLKILQEGSMDIFEDYPELHSFGWNQTLEWNDEEYVVRVPTWEGQLKLNGEWFDEFDKTVPPTVRLAGYEVLNFLTFFEEEDLAALLGKGVEVQISRESVHVITEE